MRRSAPVRRVALLIVVLAAALSAQAAVGAPAAPNTLTVVINSTAPSAAGSVSNGGAINCPPTCSAQFKPLQHVTLTASAAAGYQFYGWEGCDTSSGASCGVTMSGNRKVTAIYLSEFTTTVVKNGTGAGSVDTPAEYIGQDLLIDCGAVCSRTVALSASSAVGFFVRLYPHPGANSDIAGWSGCDQTAPPNPDDPNALYGFCQVNFGEVPAITRTITATFNLKRFAVKVTKQGSGTGTVASSPAGISCGGDCAESYEIGKTVNLTATAAQGSTFVAWGGACSGAATTCTVTVDKDLSVTATFDLAPGGGGGGGTGGGGGGGGGAADTQVDASLIAVHAAKTKLGQRVVKVELEADEQLDVLLELVRKGKVLASRHVATFKDGTRVLNLVVPSAVKKGTATLRITLKDGAGNTETLTKSVRLPAR